MTHSVDNDSGRDAAPTKNPVREPPVALIIGSSVPAWSLSATGFILAIGCSAISWQLSSAWVLLPIAVFASGAYRPSVVTLLLSLLVLLSGVIVVQDSITPITSLSLLTVHLLFVVYSVTAAVPRTARISLPAMRTLGVMALNIQAVAQALLLTAWLTSASEPITAVAVLGSLAALALVLILRRAFIRGPRVKAKAQSGD